MGKNDRLSEDLLVYVLRKGFSTVVSDDMEDIYPSLYDVQKWLREKHRISVEPFSISGNKWQSNLKGLEDIQGYFGVTDSLPTYEEALHEGIRKALEII